MKKLNKDTVNKKELPFKILQFGEGNFLRAFADWMIDKANRQGVMNHGIVVVQPIEHGENIYRIFKEQDCLYHVYLEGISDKKPIKEISRIESIMDIVNPYYEYEKYEELFLRDELEILLSNTTEAGIRYEEDDLDALPPHTFPGKMTALLYKRYKKFNGATDKGLSIICCELIEENGSTLLEYILRHAAASRLEEGFAEWLRTSCRFYDTLVDRIVPGFPRENIDCIKEEIGFDDNLVVKGEYFHVWAIGGDPALREKLPLDKAGFNVLFMGDIKPFRAKKVRILNGSHTAMVPVALQLGCETVMDAFGRPEVEKYIRCLVDSEILPVINEDREELKMFADRILERFYNPYLKHYLKDISLNSLSKWEARNYPTLSDNYKVGKDAPLTLFSFAALLVLYSEKSAAPGFVPNDNPAFVEFIRSRFNPEDIAGWVNAVVNHTDMWNTNLYEIPSVGEKVTLYIQRILAKGMSDALCETMNEARF